MENDLKLAFALDSYIDVKAFDDFNSDLIFSKFKDFSVFIRENIPAYLLQQLLISFMKFCVLVLIIILGLSTGLYLSIWNIYHKCSFLPLPLLLSSGTFIEDLKDTT
ncbi:hypothetical protein BH10BAC5_BH10BAC5_24450 [soil metagenome]